MKGDLVNSLLKFEEEAEKRAEEREEKRRKLELEFEEKRMLSEQKHEEKLFAMLLNCMHPIITEGKYGGPGTNNSLAINNNE